MQYEYGTYFRLCEGERKYLYGQWPLFYLYNKKYKKIFSRHITVPTKIVNCIQTFQHTLHLISILHERI